MSVNKEDLISQKMELQEQITAVSRESAQLAERRRNEALGIFAAISLLLSIFAYFGLEQIAASQIKKLGANTILQQAKDAAEAAESHRDSAKESATTLNSMLSSFEEQGLIQECRICFRETEGSSQCQGSRSSCSGWSSSPSWTNEFRDDTDDRGGGCEYQWKLECR